MKKLSVSIAGKIKLLRQEKGLNQQTLAVRAGLTRSYISILESGKKVPAVATLAKIAAALGVRVGLLFEDDESFPDLKMVRLHKDEIKKLVQFDSDDFSTYFYMPLAREKQKKIMDPFLIRIVPGKKNTQLFVHLGEEFNYVLEGTLKFTYGDEDLIFKEGECFYCDSSIPHNMEALNNKPVCLLSVNAAIPEIKSME